MHGVRHVTALCSALLALAGACADGPAPVEEGAILLSIEGEPSSSAAPIPEYLRVSVFDDGGPLFREERLPRTGNLAPPKGNVFGTVFIQLGQTRGNVRVLVRGIRGQDVILEGVLRVGRDDVDKGRLALKLVTPRPDEDADGVPDELDDCPRVANPEQGGCPPTDAAPPDATAADGGGTAADAIPEPDAVATSDTVGITDAAMDGAPATDASPLPDVLPPDASSSVPDTRPPDSAPLANGVRCSAAGQCASGHCVDGVCCNESCGEDCRSCATGVCSRITRGEDPPVCMAPRRCNPVGKCVRPEDD